MHWVEACIVFIHLPGTTKVTHPEPTANEGEDNQKVWMAKKNPIDPGYDLAHSLHLPRLVRNTIMRRYPTTDRSNTTRKKCPPSAAYIIPFRVILLSLSASFDVSSLRSRITTRYVSTVSVARLVRQLHMGPRRAQHNRKARLMRFGPTASEVYEAWVAGPRQTR